jgi:hypothetical protein
MDQPLKEAAKLGFAKGVMPAAFAPDREREGLALAPLSQLDELVAWFGAPDTHRRSAG